MRAMRRGLRCNALLDPLVASVPFAPYSDSILFHNPKAMQNLLVVKQ